MSETTTNTPAPKASGLAIAGLVLGIVAALGSFIPIINNVSFFLALIGLVLAIIALVGAIKGKNSSKGMAIAGVVLCAVSCVVVLVTQSAFKAALDSTTSGSKPVATSSADQSSSSAQDAAAQSSSAQEEQKPEQKPEEKAEEKPEAKDFTNLAVGTSVELGDGLVITVNSVEPGIQSYGDKVIVGVNVTYANNGSKSQSFNPYDWKGEDANGAQRTTTFYMDGTDELNSGKLSPGGSVTGNMYFEDGTVRVLYYNNMFNDEPTASWNLQ